MTTCLLYVGDPEDPGFFWEGGEWSGNIPGILLELDDLTLLRCVGAMQLLKSAQYGGKQVDWGAFAARLQVQQIQAFVEEFYRDEPREPVASLDRLDPEKRYLLVACELD